MIKNLNPRSKEAAECIWAVQIPAYTIEAELIGFPQLPPLSETVADIMASKDHYIGYFEGKDLIGFLSYAKDGETIIICSLVVHPDHFRKGVGRSLLSWMIENVAGKQKMAVTTGERNGPAMALYRSFDFRHTHSKEIAPGIHLAFLERKGCSKK
ncbi:GNAT family N-acetyltransferase [Bacillus testis]|uniref:GNAT family N-acetyltransferase n=1 Tax=Bacillus testis TaxID=1622072 RepID=UPI00067EB15E|nr:GNAT family N-acetyltransferase [Bacillus testis]